jgi:hypothetical protein
MISSGIPVRNLSHLSATVRPMTPSSPVPVPATQAPPVAPDGPPVGELGLIWFLAHCARCSGEDLSQPFRTQVVRDSWAIEHMAATGHTVSLSVDEASADSHLSAYLRRTDDGDGFKWLCMAGSCVTWIGPYDTPQLALADWRGHPEAAR